MVIWKDIKGYEGLYQISNSGEVKSLSRAVKNRYSTRTVKEKILVKCIDKMGYYKVNLSKNDKKKTYKIHKLVADHFLNEKNECVNHKDGNKLNNSVDNLEYTTYSYNNIHANSLGLVKHRKGEHSLLCKKSDKEVNEIKMLYSTGKYTTKDLAKIFNVSYGWVGKVIRGERRST